MLITSILSNSYLALLSFLSGSVSFLSLSPFQLPFSPKVYVLQQNMDNEKVRQLETNNPYNVEHQDIITDPGIPTHVSTSHEMDWGETTNDIADMKRLGKKQEFKARMSPAWCNIQIS